MSENFKCTRCGKKASNRDQLRCYKCEDYCAQGQQQGNGLIEQSLIAYAISNAVDASISNSCDAPASDSSSSSDFSGGGGDFGGGGASGDY